MSNQDVHLARSTTDLLRDAEVALLKVIDEHRCECRDYPECSRCMRMEQERADARLALTWLMMSAGQTQP